jgi:glycosyltransferase involved in cell wall biosynthesis
MLEDDIQPMKKVRLVRTDKREGLIRARILGANNSKGTVLVFLDSHCECAEGNYFRFHLREHSSDGTFYEIKDCRQTDENTTDSFFNQDDYFRTPTFRPLTIRPNHPHPHPQDIS